MLPELKTCRGGNYELSDLVGCNYKIAIWRDQALVHSPAMVDLIAGVPGGPVEWVEHGVHPWKSGTEGALVPHFGLVRDLDSRACVSDTRQWCARDCGSRRTLCHLKKTTDFSR